MNNVVFLKTAVVALTTSAYLSLTNTAQAAIFTSKSAFLNATSGLTTVDFEGLTPPNTVASVNLNNSTISGVTFSNSANFSFIVNCATLPNPFGVCESTIPLVGPTTVAGTGSASNTITASLPAGITAVGVDLLPFSRGYTVSISTGDSQIITNNNDVKFVGFTSTTPITSLSIFSAEGQVFDNLVYGQANGNPPPPIGTPEPSIMLGLLTVSGIGLRQLKRTKGK